MRRFCVYGKGGIGKSTIVSNIAAALSKDGRIVMVIGCDPKADTTRNLIGRRIPTILDSFRNEDAKRTRLNDIVFQGFNGVYCAEAGGPEPGVGCAGRGILTAADILKRLNAFEEIRPDVIIYDVLGDVVCGGFALPLKNNLADDVYIVTTCDPMAIYAANNICKGIKKFAERGQVYLGGLIYNGRSSIDAPFIIEKFAKKLGTRVVGKLPMSNLISRSETHHKTVVEYAPESIVAEEFMIIAREIYNNRTRIAPKPLSDHDLDDFINEIDHLFQERDKKE